MPIRPRAEDPCLLGKHAQYRAEVLIQLGRSAGGACLAWGWCGAGPLVSWLHALGLAHVNLGGQMSAHALIQTSSL